MKSCYAENRELIENLADYFGVSVNEVEMMDQVGTTKRLLNELNRYKKYVESTEMNRPELIYFQLERIQKKLNDDCAPDEEIEAIEFVKMMIREKVTGYAE